MHSFAADTVHDFLSLFYPRLCEACGQALHRGEEVICTGCQYALPQTHYHEERNNAMEKHFWGRVDVFRAASFYFFQKGSRIQHLIHQLKYRGKAEIGVRIGTLYGSLLREQSDYRSAEAILPVPLHPTKERQRGYNQVSLFCEGISSAMEIPWLKENLVRNRATETQTHKTRFERWENVGSVFQISDPETLEGKHVLLCDDVITTGSTLEACTRAILAVAGTTVSIATIACAVK
jgi:ComF family protein